MTTPPPIPLAQQISYMKAVRVQADKQTAFNEAAVDELHRHRIMVPAILASLQSLEARVVAAKREGMEEAAKIVDKPYNIGPLDLKKYLAKKIRQAAAKLGTETGEKG